MENASKALIMAGSMLIGVIIISIGVYVFASFGGTSKQIQEQIDSRVLAEFNNNFLKYQGSKECTIHDIVSLANFAKQNNKENEVERNTTSEYYISVYLNKVNISEYDESRLIELLKDSINGVKHYKVTEVNYNNQKKVKLIKFEEV